MKTHQVKKTSVIKNVLITIAHVEGGTKITIEGADVQRLMDALMNAGFTNDLSLSINGNKASISDISKDLSALLVLEIDNFYRNENYYYSELKPSSMVNSYNMRKDVQS